MISKYEDLYPLCKVDLPSIPTALLLQYLQQAGRQWCRDTETWIDRISMPLVNADDADTAAYDTAITAGKSTSAATMLGDVAYDTALEYTLLSNYNAEIIRPLHVWDSADADDTPMGIDKYEFTPSTGTLRLLSAPDADTVTTWATLLAYASGDKVNHETHNYECAIAHTAGTFATDLTAGKWVQIPDDLIIDVVVTPRLYTVELAAHFMEKWSEAIVAKTKVDLMAMKDKNWSSPDRVAFFTAEYNKYLSMALRERFTDNKSAGIRFDTRPWIP